MPNRVVELQLIDGSPNHMYCTLANWSGLVLKLSGTKLDQLAWSPSMQRSGLAVIMYSSRSRVLCSTSNIAKEAGEYVSRHGVEGIENCFLFTSERKTFTSEQLAYITALVSAGKVDKRKASEGLSDIQISILDEFYENMRLIMGALGYGRGADKKSEEKTEKVEKANREKKYTHTFRSAGHVTGIENADKSFTVLKGSSLYKYGTECKDKRAEVLRGDLEINGVLNSHGVLLMDWAFTDKRKAALAFSGSTSKSSFWTEVKD